MYARFFGTEAENAKSCSFAYEDTLGEFNNGIEMTSIFQDIYPSIKEVALVIKGSVYNSTPNIELKVLRQNKRFVIEVDLEDLILNARGDKGHMSD